MKKKIISILLSVTLVLSNAGMVMGSDFLDFMESEIVEKNDGQNGSALQEDTWDDEFSDEILMEDIIESGEAWESDNLEYAGIEEPYDEFESEEDFL